MSHVNVATNWGPCGAREGSATRAREHGTRVVQGGQATLDRRRDRLAALVRHGVEEAEKPA